MQVSRSRTLQGKRGVSSAVGAIPIPAIGEAAQAEAMGITEHLMQISKKFQAGDYDNVLHKKRAYTTLRKEWLQVYNNGKKVAKRNIGDKKDELNTALSQHEALHTFLTMASNSSVTFSQMDAALKGLEAVELSAPDCFCSISASNTVS